MTITSFTATLVATFPTSLRWWLKDPLNPSASVQVSMQPGKFEEDGTDPQQVVYAVGRPDPVVMRDTIKLPTLTLPFRFLTDSEYQAVQQLRAAGRTLLLQAPQEIGQWYIVLGPSEPVQINLATVRGWSTSGLLVRDVQYTATVVASP